MLKIELKELHKEAELVAEYFTAKTKARAKVRGASLELDQLSAKEAKLLLHKFLHHNGLDGYRVVVEHPGLIEVLSPEPSASHFQREEGSPPSAPVTMPYYFPGSAGPVPPNKKRKK